MAVPAAQQGLVPSTPHRQKSIHEANQLIQRTVEKLNNEFPQLMLRKRTPDETPGSRESSHHELCYDQLVSCCFRNRDKLEPSIALFRIQAKDAPPHVSLAGLLIDCLPSLGSSVQLSRTTTPVSSFAQKMRDAAPRPKTPEPEEEVTAVPEPASPSAGRSSVVRPRGLKRQSNGELPTTSPPKVSRASNSSRSTIYVTSPLSPNYPQLPNYLDLNDSASSFHTAPRISFGSTNFGLDGAGDVGANISFDTNYTIPDRSPDTIPEPRPRYSDPYSSIHSVPSSVLRQMDDRTHMSNGRSDSTSNLSSKINRVQQWRQDVRPGTNSSRSTHPKESFTKSSTRSETREALYHLQESSPRVLQHPQVSPSQALSQMHIRETTPSPVTAEIPPFAKPADACAQIQDLPNHGMFFPDVIEADLEYRSIWECQRWSLVTGLPVERFFCCVPADTDDYGALFETLKRATIGCDSITLPTRSSRLTWQHARQDDRRSHLRQQPASGQEAIPQRGTYDVQYKARISFSDSKNAPHLFKTTLLPLFSDKSCRFQRRYGSHRVLYVDVPELGKVPKHFKGQTHLQSMFLEWLCAPKQFLGRNWRAIHLEQSKSKKTDGERFLGYRVVLLALSGGGLESLDLDLVFSHFMRLKDDGNMERPFRKLFSRIDLGFSKTIASVTFKPSQVLIFTDDICADDTPESGQYRDPACDWVQQAHLVSKEGDNMTDGCSNMSVAAMKAIWSKMGRSGALPAAIQGRIGGAKGVWVRSGPADSTEERDLDMWIEIRKSQLKFEFPKDDTDDDFDEFQWTLEVSSMTESRGHEFLCGSLHLDMIPLLVDRGVPLENIEEVMVQALVGQDEMISEVLKDPLETRYWVEAHDSDKKEGKQGPDDEADSTIPISYSARAKYLLDHGFDPRHSAYLCDMLRAVAKDYFSKAIQKLKVKLPCSVNLMGIADPYNVLEPDTVHVGFSRSFEDTLTGEYITHLHNVPGIITRFPMQLPSDIQKIKIVYDRQLEHLKDCIIFPTRGPVSLPSKLQGGDLDGDRFVLIWDERLVSSFKNAPVIPAKRPLDYFGVVKDNRKLEDVFVGTSPVQNFLREGFKARLQRVPLGLTSNFLGRLAYRLGDSAYRNLAVHKLAELYTLLIDADKQGHNFDERGFTEYIEREPHIPQWLKTPGKPEYTKAIEIGIETRLGRDNFTPRHPNDVIYFKHVHPSMMQVLKQIDDVLKISQTATDNDLKFLCESARMHSNPAVRNQMKLLGDELQILRQNWSKDHNQNKDKTKIVGIIEKYRARYAAITPLNGALPETSTARRLPHEPSTWDLLKASALYSVVPARENQGIIFQLAGTDLAYIKAQSGSRRLVRSEMYAFMKLRKRKLEPIFELSSGDQDEEGDDSDEVFESSEDLNDADSRPTNGDLRSPTDVFQDAVEEMDGIMSSAYY